MAFRVIDRQTVQGVQIEVLEYETLKGSSDPGISQHLFYASKMGIKLRQIKITLSNGEVVTEAGSLSFSNGRIVSENKIRSVGFKRVLNTMLNNESLFRPSYSGSGEVYLEPTFKHYKVLHLDNDALVLNEGMFLCSTRGVEVSITTMKNISSAIFGSEGLTQTVVKGSGLVVIEIPVPEDEIIDIDITNGSEVKVDGNFAIMRTMGVDYAVTTSTKGLLRSWLGGNGLVENFKGNGRVWLAPTVPMYRELSNYRGNVPSDYLPSNGNGNPNPGKPDVGSGGPGGFFNNFRG